MKTATVQKRFEVVSQMRGGPRRWAFKSLADAARWVHAWDTGPTCRRPWGMQVGSQVHGFNGFTWTDLLDGPLNDPATPYRLELLDGPAEALKAALARVNEAAVPVMSRDRSLRRKDQAALTRKLFRELGLSGISVTAPSYSMAHSVDVKLPRFHGHQRDKWPHDHAACCGLGGHPPAAEHDEADRCPACRDDAALSLAVEEVLARAFPNHDDRSESQSDYFDFKWSMT